MLDSELYVLRRLIALRQFPLLGVADLAELAILAENLVETRYRAGALIAPAGVRPVALHLVVDGGIQMGARRYGPRSAFAALEVLARRELHAAAYAVGETRTLQLASRDLVDLLEENFGVLRSTLRELAGRVLVHGRPAPPSLIIPPADPLSFVDRLVLLRQQSPYFGARLDALAALAHAAEELRFARGDVIARAGDIATATHVVLEGALRATGPEGRVRELGPGDAIGALETLAEARHTATFEVQQPTRVLAAGAAAVLDTLEDHTDFGLSIVARLAGALAERAAEAHVEHAMHEVTS